MLNDDDALMNEDDVPEAGDETGDVTPEPTPRAVRRPRKPAARTSKKAAKPAATKAAKAAARSKAAKPASKAAAPEGFTRVKAGGHSVWLTRELARALSAKDKRKLKALFKRAARRRKSA
jgi:hypothetical protein